MKLVRSIIASTVLLAAGKPAAAQSGEQYIFQHQISIHKSSGGCALSIIYPEQGPLTFEYKPEGNAVRISYQIDGTAGLTGDNQELSFVLNATDPSPNATESATYNDSGKGSVTVVNDHLLISLTAPDGDRLIDFLGRAYSISFSYKIVEGDSGEIEGFSLWDLSTATERLKKCAEAVSSQK